MDDPGAHPASESGRRTSICGYWTYCATTPGARRASLALSCGVLGARPGRGVALEGSPTGAVAARGAGLYVIEVPSTPGVAPDAHGVVGSLTEAAVRRAVSLATTWGR